MISDLISGMNHGEVLKENYMPFSISTDLSTPVLPCAGVSKIRFFGEASGGDKGEKNKYSSRDASVERSSEEEDDRCRAGRSNVRGSKASSRGGCSRRS